MFFQKKYKETTKIANIIYKLIVNQARSKEFYSHLEVPDTIDGRFELIILHFFFIEKSLDKKNEKHEAIYNKILDIMYNDFDMNLREMGVGDLSVGKKIYQMSEAFSGRIFAYRRSSKKNKKLIKGSIRKNVYGTVKDINDNYINIMVNYFIDSLSFVSSSLKEDIAENNTVFLDINRYIK